MTIRLYKCIKIEHNIEKRGAIRKIKASLQYNTITTLKKRCLIIKKIKKFKKKCKNTLYFTNFYAESFIVELLAEPRNGYTPEID